MNQHKIAKNFVEHISKKLRMDFMYFVKDSNYPYEKGQSDVDILIVPIKCNIHPYYYIWMYVEGIRKFGICDHKNKKTGEVKTSGLLDVMLFVNEEAQDNCRKVMKDIGKYREVKW